MTMRSDNTPTKNRTSNSIIPLSSNSAVKNRDTAIITKSSNGYTRNFPNNIIQRGQNILTGENITPAPAGFDDIYSGIAGGQNLGGEGPQGIQHFESIKNRP